MNSEILAANLKFLRTAYGMSQAELARKIHIHRSTYCSYETGAKLPDLKTLDALTSVYNIGFESLINHDLSSGLMSKIYFDAKGRAIADLLHDYEKLSISSKSIIMERLDVLIEREAVFYQEFANPRKNKK